MKRLTAWIKRHPQELRRFAKFLVVGMSSTLIDVGMFALLVHTFAMATLPANILSYSLGMAYNFTVNRAWTYREARQKAMLTQLGQFLLINVVGLCLNSVLVIMFSAILHLWIGSSAALVGKLLSTAVVMFWNFFINRLWTFSDVVPSRASN